MRAKTKRGKIGFLTVPVRVCANEGCGQSILTTYSGKIYCSGACRTAAHRKAKAAAAEAHDRKAATLARSRAGKKGGGR